MSKGIPYQAELLRRWHARRSLWSKAVHSIDLAGKTILDAGTGEGHATRFLAEQSPKQIVSVTCREEEIAPALGRVGELTPVVDFTVGDLTKAELFGESSFDLVWGDFLIAAVAGITPFQEAKVVRNLVRWLRPGGRIILTGWELEERPAVTLDSRARRLFRKIASLRDAGQTLKGQRGFREHPSFWIREQLEASGVFGERTETVPDIHRDIRWLTENTRQVLEDVEPAELAAILLEELRKLEGELSAALVDAGGIEVGQLYAVIGLKTTGGLLLNME